MLCVWCVQVSVELKKEKEEREKLQNINDQYKVHYNKKKAIITELEAKLAEQTTALENARAVEDKYAHMVTPLQDKYNVEVARNKKLGMSVFSGNTTFNILD